MISTSLRAGPAFGNTGQLLAQPGIPDLPGFQQPPWTGCWHLAPAWCSVIHIMHRVVPAYKLPDILQYLNETLHKTNMKIHYQQTPNAGTLTNGQPAGIWEPELCGR